MDRSYPAPSVTNPLGQPETTILEALQDQRKHLDQAISDVYSALGMPAYPPTAPTITPMAVPATPLHELHGDIGRQIERLDSLRAVLRL